MEERLNYTVNDLARVMVLDYLRTVESAEVGRDQACYILLCQVLQKIIKFCSYSDYLEIYNEAFKAVEIGSIGTPQDYQFSD